MFVSLLKTSSRFTRSGIRHYAALAEQVKRKPRTEGTIASVFASLSGEKFVELPSRFVDLKRELVASDSAQRALQSSWNDLCSSWKSKVVDIENQGSDIIPEVEYEEVRSGMSESTINQIKDKGVVIVRGVVEEAKALEWLDSIKNYIKQNPQVKGFPEDDPAVYEIYWSKAQLEARSHPASLEVQRALLSLFNKNSAAADAVSFSTPLTYCDRLRIRKPGDAQFTLGPHCDGGSVERWEDPTYRKSYEAILQGRWRTHDAWDIAGRTHANMNLYDGPGACGVFRALQGWTSLSHTGAGEGTLKVLPAIKEATAYFLLRPFFKPLQPRESLSEDAFLNPSNWTLNLESPDFPNSPLGRSQELNDITHPHLKLQKTMIPLKSVKPGDQAWWHCDAVHSVEASHNGTNASSVLYIPSVPLTLSNIQYIKDQRDNFLAGTPPADFPGGIGESNFKNKGEVNDILTMEGKRGMGLAPFDLGSASSDSERLLLSYANRMLGF